MQSTCKKQYLGSPGLPRPAGGAASNGVFQPVERKRQISEQQARKREPKKMQSRRRKAGRKDGRKDGWNAHHVLSGYMVIFIKFIIIFTTLRT